MNKKGFTLTEILGVIIILGILAVISITVFTGSMKGFREDYYTETVRTVTESGKEFFNDNRKYRPSEVLGAQIVPLNTLVAQHYIDDIKDYKGNSCSYSSYVIVIKNGKDDYTYHTCLVCPEDDFNNLNDKYCDSAWTNSTTVEYSIARPPELFRYKGIPRSVLKEELGIKASYVKKNSKGEVIGVVDGAGFDESPTIYPDNVDAVDPDTLGKYELTYTYLDQKVTGHVTIYEYNSPPATITKENVVAKDLAGNTEIQKTTYESGQWAQKIYVTLTRGVPNAGEGVSIGDLSNIVHKYQWNKDGIWQDFCAGDDCSNVEVTTEMNENISFRSVDINGITSEETTPITIKIDNTKPTCSIISSGQHKDNPDWYTSDVNINFTKYDDIVGTSPESVSGLRIKNITINTGTLNRETDVLSAVNITDTKGVTYVGYVEDLAENFIMCTESFKRDVTDPVCELKTEGTMGDNEWYVSGSVKTSFSQSYDATSDVRTYGIGSYTGNQTINNSSNTAGITYTGYIKDNAGNTSSCSVSYKKDSTNPTCSIASSNNWTIEGVTLSVTCSDGSGPSGCDSGRSQIGGSSLKTGLYTYTVYDNAGNTGNCSENVLQQIQRSDRTCNYGNRCSQAADGCETWNECEDWACGSQDCNCSDCHTGSNTCVPGCGSGGSCSGTAVNCTGEGCPKCSWFGTESGCEGNMGCSWSCNWSNCASGSNTCKYGCDECPRKCRHPNCDCETWHQDIINCGCASWSEYGPWYDVSSCTENTNNNMNNNNICRILYYVSGGQG